MALRGSPRAYNPGAALLNSVNPRMDVRAVGAPVLLGRLVRKHGLTRRNHQVHLCGA